MASMTPTTIATICVNGLVFMVQFLSESEMNAMSDRDTHFQGFAKLLWHEVRKTSFDSPGFSHYQQLEKHLQLLFAQRAYDLVQSACIDISDEQMEQGMRLSPNAMLRAVADLTERPPKDELQ